MEVCPHICSTIQNSEPSFANRHTNSFEAVYSEYELPEGKQLGRIMDSMNQFWVPQKFYMVDHCWKQAAHLDRYLLCGPMSGSMSAVTFTHGSSFGGRARQQLMKVPPGSKGASGIGEGWVAPQLSSPSGLQKLPCVNSNFSFESSV